MSHCIFCQIVRGEAPAARVYEDEEFLAFLDIHPLRPGHTLVIPKAHIERVGDAAPDESGRLFALATRIGAAVESQPDCRGVNYLLNDGRAANQSVPHVHVHVVPRTGRDFSRLLANLVLHLSPVQRRVPHSQLVRHARAIADAVSD